MEDKFEIGDVVFLKSGGLPMCIQWNKSTDILCKWHDLDGRPHESTFNEKCLTKKNPIF